jgi:Family of unknown function (DUF5519)
MKSSEIIQNAMLEHEGVTTHPHRFGGTEYRLGKREIGHVHGERLVDIPFPKAVRDEVIAVSLAEPHHLLPKSGWISLYLRQEQDTHTAVQLLNRSLEIARVQVQNRESRGLYE